MLFKRTVSQKILALALGVGAITTAGAREVPEALEELLNQRERPTIQQVKEVLDRSPEVKEYLSSPAVEQAYVSRVVNEVVPTMVLFEKVMPGATLYPLGRDSVIMGDAIEALYLKLGEKDRVRRIDLSGPSFRSSSGDIRDYLSSIGLDPFNLIRKDRKAVIFDRSSYHSHSQSYRLLNSMYERYQSKTGDKSGTLTNHVLFFGLRQREKLKESLVGKKLEGQMKAIQGSSKANSGFAPRITLQLPGLTDSVAWHDSWGSLKRLEGRTVVPSPGRNQGYNHLEVLRELAALIKIADSPDVWFEVMVQRKRQGLSTKEISDLAKGGVSSDERDRIERKRIAETILTRPKEILERIKELTRLNKNNGFDNWVASDEGRRIAFSIAMDVPTLVGKNSEESKRFYTEFLPEALRLTLKTGFRYLKTQAWYNPRTTFTYEINMFWKTLETLIPNDPRLSEPCIQVLREFKPQSIFISKMLSDSSMDALYRGQIGHFKKMFNLRKKHDLVDVLRMALPRRK